MLPGLGQIFGPDKGKLAVLEGKGDPRAQGQVIFNDQDGFQINRLPPEIVRQLEPIFLG
ncbi:hypothetical protein [Syntrophobotulus glycolicus]|uniref:hypothetical protein n=1 Tax=Syntrophobotulus glycolicus TaxID=51197 RepID=UPI001FA70014|nr:hypothetical protein [Syntrophobotulus glycolicus]